MGGIFYIFNLGESFLLHRVPESITCAKLAPLIPQPCKRYLPRDHYMFLHGLGFPLLARGDKLGLQRKWYDGGRFYLSCFHPKTGVLFIIFFGHVFVH